MLFPAKGFKELQGSVGLRSFPLALPIFSLLCEKIHCNILGISPVLNESSAALGFFVMEYSEQNNEMRLVVAVGHRRETSLLSTILPRLPVVSKLVSLSFRTHCLLKYQRAKKPNNPQPSGSSHAAGESEARPPVPAGGAQNGQSPWRGLLCICLLQLLAARRAFSRVSASSCRSANTNNPIWVFPTSA